jgi:hypothetical protein
VDFFLSVDGGAHYDLQEGDLTAGEYRLTVPHTPSRFCKLKLERAIPPSVAVTDSFFTIETSVALLGFAARPAPEGEPGTRIEWRTGSGLPARTRWAAVR